MWRSWALFIPGLDALSWPNFFFGLFANFAYGIYGALVFVPLYNFFAQRFRKKY